MGADSMADRQHVLQQACEKQVLSCIVALSATVPANKYQQET